MNSNMIRTLIAGMVLACASLSPALIPQAAAHHNSQEETQQTQLNQHQLQQMLAIAADYWNMSIATASQAYEDGALTYTITGSTSTHLLVKITYDSEDITEMLLLGD
jgi:hypothetical protein